MVVIIGGNPASGDVFKASSEGSSFEDSIRDVTRIGFGKGGGEPSRYFTGFFNDTPFPPSKSPGPLLPLPSDTLDEARSGLTLRDFLSSEGVRAFTSRLGETPLLLLLTLPGLEEAEGFSR
jgi:hypothetical protein